MSSIKFIVILVNSFSLVTLDTSINFNIKGKINAESKSLPMEPGIFHRFLREFLTMATTGIPEKKLSQFTRTLFRNINELEYRYSKKLAKKLKKIFRLHRDEIQGEYQEFLDTLNAENEPRKLEFLGAMDDVFTGEHVGRFNDYIMDMEEFGRGEKRDLEEETRRLVHDVIHNTILSRGQHNMKELEKKLKRALKEQGYSIYHHRKRDGGVMALGHFRKKISS